MHQVMGGEEQLGVHHVYPLAVLVTELVMHPYGGEAEGFVKPHARVVG